MPRGVYKHQPRPYYWQKYNMAIFATNNKFNIKDEESAGFYGKPPQKPKIWGYLFWIILLVLLITLFWSAFTSRAEAVLWQQQADGFSRTLPISAGQTNFNLGSINSTTTIQSIQIRAFFNGNYWQGKDMKVCVYSMTQSAYPYSFIWSVDDLIGCESRTIQSAEINIEQDFKFSGSDIILPPNEDITYGFLVVESGYESDPLSWHTPPEENYYKLYYTQSENGTTYGGAYDGYAEWYSSTTIGVWLQSVPNYWADTMFIISGLGIPPGLPPGMINCEGGSFFDYLLCQLYVSLFVPSDTALNTFSDLWDNIKNKPPFGYAVAINTAISGINIGTTTLQFAGISEISFFGTLKSALAIIFWFLFIFWIFHRLRNFDF